MSSKQREALEEIHCHITNYLGGKLPETKMLMDVKNIINKALADPIRNCDVGTAEEQKQRFEVFCSRGNCDNCSFAEEGVWANCAIRWEQMPYESEVNNDR